MKKIFLITAAILLLNGCTLFGQENLINTHPQIPTNNSANKKILNLSNQQLTKLPDYVLQQTNLEELNISQNQITGAIPSQIQNLKNLKTLNMSNNRMTGIPAEIGQLQKLETLDLSNNQFTGLPNELGNLKNLKTLNLSGNNYSPQDLITITANLPANITIIK
jgi:Leucine-rich repeat (LRR) protein